MATPKKAIDRRRLGASCMNGLKHGLRAADVESARAYLRAMRYMLNDLEATATAPVSEDSPGSSDAAETGAQPAETKSLDQT